MTVTYNRGAGQPSVGITWRANDNSVIDFSAVTDWEVRIGSRLVNRLTKTANITGAATAPNVRITFTEVELESVPAGRHLIEVTARPDNEEPRVMKDVFIMDEGVAA